jgi:hypothetical protein
VHDEPTPQELRALAMQHWRGRSNAFFQEEDSRLSFAELGEVGLAGLHQQLSSVEDLQALPADVDFMRDRPAAAMERMAMLDLLGELAEQDPAALSKLADLARAPIDRNLPDHVKRVLVVERHEVLTNLARLDWMQAASSFAELPGEGLRELLRPALIEGLMSGGMAHEEAQRLAATA